MYHQLEFCQVEVVGTSTPSKKIHIIRCPSQKALKITISSRSPEDIVKQMKQGNPHALEVYMSFYGTKDTKEAILQECKAFSLHGDWLQDSEEVLQYLKSQLNYLAEK